VSLPASLSQCSLLRRVNISDTLMSRPPAVLFSIPRLRAHPEQILFAAEQRCTRELAECVILDTGGLGHIAFECTGLGGGSRRYWVGPGVTTREFFALANQDLAQDQSQGRDLAQLAPYVFLVREREGAVPLLIANDAVPIALYAVPDARWSFELRLLLPPRVRPEVAPLVARWVRPQERVPGRRDDALADIGVVAERADLRGLSERLTAYSAGGGSWRSSRPARSWSSQPRRASPLSRARPPTTSSPSTRSRSSSGMAWPSWRAERRCST